MRFLNCSRHSMPALVLQSLYDFTVRLGHARLDGRPVQVVDRHDAPVEELSDSELYLIASGGLPRSEQPQALLMPPKPGEKA